MNRRKFIVGSLATGAFPAAVSTGVQTVARTAAASGIRKSSVGLIGHIDAGKVKMSSEMLKYISRLPS